MPKSRATEPEPYYWAPDQKQRPPPLIWLPFTNPPYLWTHKYCHSPTPLYASVMYITRLTLSYAYRDLSQYNMYYPIAGIWWNKRFFILFIYSPWQPFFPHMWPDCCCLLPRLPSPPHPRCPIATGVAPSFHLPLIMPTLNELLLLGSRP